MAAAGCGSAVMDFLKYSVAALFLSMVAIALGAVATHQGVTGGPYVVPALVGFAIALVAQIVFALKAIGALARLLGKTLTFAWIVALTIISALAAGLAAVLQFVPGLDLLPPFIWLLVGIWALRRLRAARRDQTPPPRHTTRPPLLFTRSTDSTDPDDRAA
jgi:uncharacterized membrane protein YfcA